MQHVHRIRELDGIDGPVRVTVKVLNDLENAGPETLSRFRLTGIAAELRDHHRETHVVLDAIGKLQKNAIRVAHPT